MPMEPIDVDAAGARLYCETVGSGPTLLIIGTATTRLESFRNTALMSNSRYRVIIYDQRGTGVSALPGPALDHSIAQHADDAADILRALSPEPAFVCGLSSGALIGMDLICRYPERIRGLVMHEPPAYEILPDAFAHNTFFQSVVQLARTSGVAAAMTEYSKYIGFVDSDTDWRYADFPDDYANFSPDQRRQYADIVATGENFVEHQLLQFNGWMPDLHTLGTHSDRLVGGMGTESWRLRSAAPITELAARLRVPLVEFPGGHLGWINQEGYFRMKLWEVLDTFPPPPEPPAVVAPPPVGFGRRIRRLFGKQ